MPNESYVQIMYGIASRVALDTVGLFNHPACILWSRSTPKGLAFEQLLLSRSAWYPLYLN